MTWADVFIKHCSDKFIKNECERRKLHKDAIPPAIIYAEITAGELADILPVDFINPWNNSKYYVRKTWWDGNFKLTSDDEVKRFLTWNLVDKEEYVADFYDCNSFAVSLWGEARKWSPGICLGMYTMVKPPHAKNWYVNEKKELRVIEPQSDVVNYKLDPYIDHFLV